MSEPSARSPGPGPYRHYGSVPIDRWYEVVRYVMPVTGRLAIVALMFNAVVASLLGSLGIAAIAPPASSGYDGHYPTDIDLWVLYPVSGAQILLGIACMGACFRVIRHSRRARRWALILTGLIALTNVTTLVLVQSELNGYGDYPIQFNDLRAFIPLAMNAVAVAFLCAPRLREWCDH